MIGLITQGYGSPTVVTQGYGSSGVIPPAEFPQQYHGYGQYLQKPKPPWPLAWGQRVRTRVGRIIKKYRGLVYEVSDDELTMYWGKFKEMTEKYSRVWKKSPVLSEEFALDEIVKEITRPPIMAWKLTKRGGMWDA